MGTTHRQHGSASRNRNLRSQVRHGYDAERRSNHGRCQCRASQNRRRSRCCCCDGARTYSCRHSPRWRCGPHERPCNDCGDPKAVSIPVMAKVRIGHFVEAQILEAMEVDYIDESGVLSLADEVHHVNKTKFKIPFVCGCRTLPEALRRIAEGAAFIRTKGEAGTGNIVEAVRHARAVKSEIKRLQNMDEDELFVTAKEMGAPLDLVQQVAAT